ncbi:hypothetical protein ACP0FZ_31730, partial [Escherichia coli]|uniref:hypothetical protein n=1 Tax=Escherichia coli TaxID=562 RepID=UPI003CE6AB71
DDLLSYKWICRNPESNTGSIFKECLEKANYPDCDTFEVTSEVTSATTIVQTVLHSDKNATVLAYNMSFEKGVIKRLAT